MVYRKIIALLFVFIFSSFLCSQVKKSPPSIKKNQKKVSVQIKKSSVVSKESKKAKTKQGKIVTANRNKKATPKKLRSNYIQYSVSKKTKMILKEAKSYLGVPYKFGGNTRKGIDCSALVKAAFVKAGMNLPRRSIEMSTKGTTIKSTKVKEGDLLFFSTSKGAINHVGIVCKIKKGGVISFIHASSSKGVRIDDLEGTYWPEKYIKAKRIM